MQFHDKAKALERLTCINYYRLRAYWLPFETPPPSGSTEPHHFRAGTYFEDIIDLYRFDRKLRLLFIDAVERVEVALRTQLATVLCNAYGLDAHQKPENFHNKKTHREGVAKLLYEYGRSKETFAKHHQDKYSDLLTPPLWVSAELLTLGELSRWFDNIGKRADKTTIADVFGMPATYLGMYLQALTLVRNLSAHHSRLWNRSLSNKLPAPDSDLSALAQKKHFTSEHHLFNCILATGHALDKISPGHSWRRRMREALDEHSAVDVHSMDFHPDWKTLIS
ncbi:Abi family protein [bacterium]|nr:Abi family protein [bacterium]